LKISDLFWNASHEELKNGFREEEGFYVCLLCGKKIEKGIVYPFKNILCDAEKYMHFHIKQEHHSVFEHLVNMDKKLTGLSNHQNELLKLFYLGKKDIEIQEEMGIGSSSTIRNHRFVLKEKEHQAKIFLVLMELLKENNVKSLRLIAPHTTAKMVDERYSIAEEENEKILNKYFTDGPEGPLKTFDMKEKSKIAVLRQIVKRFKSDNAYCEKEVNEILKNVYKDYVTVRRYLIEYGFMDRKPDGSRYWVKEEQDEMGQTKKDPTKMGQTKKDPTKMGQAKKEQKTMEHSSINRRKELIRLYKEMKPEAGVYQIKNTKNQKIFIASTVNLKTMNGKRMMLDGGTHKNKKLQEEWNKFGGEAFLLEVLEILKEKEDGFFDKTEELKKLENKWLEKLQPYGEHGYN
jgi:hypothetical protein